MVHLNNMKYSQSFERDFRWYTKWATLFNFDGASSYHDKKGNAKIVGNPQGHPAKEAFYQFDSSGRIIPTNQPLTLESLYRCKGSINLHIKQWAEGRAEGTLPRKDWEAIQAEYELLPWMIDAVHQQYIKLLQLSLS